MQTHIGPGYHIQAGLRRAKAQQRCLYGNPDCGFLNWGKVRGGDKKRGINGTKTKKFGAAKEEQSPLVTTNKGYSQFGRRLPFVY